ncbi:MAG TPA: ABC transporter ATP-binding protein [Microthrixaceae bacterium]|jgi:putative ABC transport system ATP-binding protein|nr:ABC transporter ATP-binding protein [Microthrixaceae bacterium]HQF92641.1 ABC transporter ATP-binding protein [Microthrixaceae bacterium]
MTLIVDAHDLALTYPGPPIVNAVVNAHVTVANGEYVAVTGRSGAGKSSLLSVLGGLERPTGGKYLLQGIDMIACSEGDRASVRGELIGFVFQSFLLDDRLSATQNVARGLLYRGGRGDPTERSRAALDRVGLLHRSEADAGELSGGERQRVAIARALVHQPKLLLADEPTGSLDSATSALVLDILDDLHAAGLTIVCVTHSDEVARRAQRRLVVSDGRVEPSPSHLT